MARTPRRSTTRRPATADELFREEGEFEKRMLASAMGLPRVCRLKKCRRRKRCFGFGVTCLDDHPELAHQRFPSALAVLGLSLDEMEKSEERE